MANIDYSIDEVCNLLQISKRTLSNLSKEVSLHCGQTISHYSFEGKKRFVRYSAESVELLKYYRQHRELPKSSEDETTAIVHHPNSLLGRLDDVIDAELVPMEMNGGVDLGGFDYDARIERLALVAERLDLNEDHLHQAELKISERLGEIKEIQLIEAEVRGRKKAREQVQKQRRGRLGK